MVSSLNSESSRNAHRDASPGQDTALCFWERRLTIKVPLFTLFCINEDRRIYCWNGLASHPGRSRNTPSGLSKETGISSSSDWPLDSYKELITFT